MKYSYLLPLVILFMTNVTYSQFTLDAELRPRAEISKGYRILPPDLNLDPAIYISQRTRLAAGYTIDRFEMSVALKDVRLWGDDDLVTSTGVFGNSGSILLHEAWLKVSLADNLHLKVGRQELNYDDQRLLARRNWNQAGLTYDALKLSYQDMGFSLDILGTWNNDLALILGQEYSPYKMKTLQLIHFGRKVNANFRFTGLLMGVGFTNEIQPSVIFLKGTAGGNLYYERDKWSAHASGYYQFGKHWDGQDVSAYLLSGKISVKPSSSVISLGIDYLSGFDASKQDEEYREKHRLFDIFYGGRHKFYGFMDYFNNIDRSTDGGGLTDIYLTWNAKFNLKHNLQLWFHYFAVSREVSYMQSDDELDSKYLGSEFDLAYTYSMTDYFKIDIGTSTIFDAELMRAIMIDPNYSENVPQPWWVYVMVTFNPKIIK